MNKRTLRAAALCPALLVLGGCSALGINFTDDKVQYEASNTRANLEVPPDLAPVANENRFEVPSRPGVVSANTEMARAQVAGEATQERGSIVQRTVVASASTPTPSRSGPSSQTSGRASASRFVVRTPRPATLRPNGPKTRPSSRRTSSAARSARCSTSPTPRANAISTVAASSAMTTARVTSS